MGSFSYSCRLSGLPITGGDKAVLIPLIPNGNYYDNGEEHVRKFGTTHYCSNDGPNVFFRPLAFPVFGEYDSYGCLENIEEDDNTKTLEQFFGLSIQEIVSIICSNRKDDGYDDALDVIKEGKKESRGDDYKKPKYKKEFELLIRTSGTWMRREIYDGLAQTGSSSWKDNLDLGIPAVLQSLGFKETGKTKDDRFNRVFTNGPVSLHSDGNWIQMIDSNGLYNFPALKKYCKKKGLDLDIEAISKKGMYEQIYDYILPETKSVMRDGRWEGDRIRSLFLCDRHEPSKISEFYFTETRKNGGEFLKKNIIDWHNVKGYFYIMGHYLSPVGTSPQDGEPKHTLTVINLAKTILEQDLKDRGYDEEEEEFEEEMD